MPSAEVHQKRNIQAGLVAPSPAQQAIAFFIAFLMHRSKSNGYAAGLKEKNT
jgi:hypothetical protein